MNKRKYIPFAVFAIFFVGLLCGRYVFRLSGVEYNFSLFNGNVSKLQSVLNLIDRKYVDEISIDDLTEDIIPQVLSKLDPHSTYIPADKREESEQHLVGHFSGVGIEYTIVDDTALVTNTVYGGPAYIAGIIPGDKIVSVNDSVFDNIQNLKTQISTYLRGDKQSNVKIGILRSTVDTTLFFDVKRDDIPLYSVHAGYMIDSLTAYISISSFAAHTYDELMVKIDTLKLLGMKNLIIDLRDNSGGYISTAVDIANEFLSENQPIVYTKNHNGILNNYTANGNGKLQDINLVIVVNSYTASASEILSGAFQDNDRATIVGRRTYGKGLVQEPVQLSDGSVVRITIARYYTPTGRCIQKPYDDYKNDIKKRIANGELDSVNAVAFNDSLKFITPNGKVVYGGGGIMPDIFVPLKSADSSVLFYSLNQGAVPLNTFAARCYNQFYNDSLSNDSLIDVIFNQHNILDSFVNYAKGKGFKINNADLQIDKDKILNYIRSYIYTMQNRENDSYRIVNQYDNDIISALQSFYNKTDTLQTEILNNE